MAEHRNDDWDPEWVTSRFCGLLECNNVACKELAAISGTSGASFSIEIDDEGSPYQGYEQTLDPKNIFPAPHLFNIPKNCPKPIRTHLIDGFGLIWMDYESCANKFRMAVEALLTERKIATYSKLVKGKPRRPLSPHARIELYRPKNPEAAECLEAVKWLGNFGSHHATSLKLEDVLIAADILEHVINLVYDRPPSPLNAAKKINKKKGPA